MAHAVVSRQTNAMSEKQAEVNDVATDSESRRLWTRAEYYRMAELGILKHGEKTELIEGEIFEKTSPMGAPHGAVVRRVVRVLTALFEPELLVDSQRPASFSDLSEPEPDVYVAKGDQEEYEDRHPGPQDIVLAVEVADSSLRLDRTRKAALYAQYAIPEYWMVNLIDRRLEVYREPQEGKYASIVVYGEADFVSPVAAPEEKIAVAGFLPKAKSSAKSTGVL